MDLAVSQELNPNSYPREAYGLKAESTLHRIPFSPSSVNPGETLYVNIPKLAEGIVIVPNSVTFVFNLSVVGHANSTLVSNVAANVGLVSKSNLEYSGFKHRNK